MNSVDLQKKIQNSRFSITKNFLYFIIAPLVILLVGGIILCTCGYNLGYDFTGGTTFRMYINKDNEVITTTYNYDLSLDDDYNEVYDKVVSIVEEKGGKVVSFKTTGMTILDYLIVDGQAIEVTFQNSSTQSDEIKIQNDSIKEAIITTFQLEDVSKTVSDFDVTGQRATSSWMRALVCACILAYVVALIYLMFRYSVSASLVGIILYAFDLFMTLSLMLICRVPVNMTLGGVILATTVMSMFNLFAFYYKAKEGFKAGKFEKMKFTEVGDNIVKESTFTKTIIYILLAVIMIVLSIIATAGIRFTALGMLFAVIMTYYNSQFILPTLFGVLYKKKKKKRV